MPQRLPLRADIKNRPLVAIRSAMAMGLAKGDSESAANLARQWHDSELEFDLYESGERLRRKSSVAVGDSGTAAWGGNLVQSDYDATAFSEAVYAASVLGPVSAGALSVPPKTSFGVSAGGTAAFVGDGQPAPAQKLSYANPAVHFYSCASLATVTAELARFAAPSATAILQRDLTGAIGVAIDEAFLSNAASVPNVSPQGILYGVNPIVSTGNSAAAIAADFNTALRLLGRRRKPLIFANEEVCTYWSTLTTTTGAPAFPNATALGGFMFGIPVIATGALPPTGSPSYSSVIIIETEDIALAAARSEIEVATHAAAVLDTVPGAGAQQLISLWQSNLIGVLARTSIDWCIRRATPYQSVAWISDFQIG